MYIYCTNICIHTLECALCGVVEVSFDCFVDTPTVNALVLKCVEVHCLSLYTCDNGARGWLYMMVH